MEADIARSERSLTFWLLTWRDSGGDGGGGLLALALGGHGCNFNGVGGEGSEAGDPVL